jgi:uncharacterized membrane protein YfcA
MHDLWLVPLGFAVGAFGTLIGAGGGFVLVPLLILIYPDESPDILTSTTLAVVFFNAMSGSLAYARMRRIDYKSGLLFSIASVPGAVLGAFTTSFLPRNIFDGIFGVLLIVAAIYLLVTTRPSRGAVIHRTGTESQPNSARYLTRSFTDRRGESYTYSFDPVVGTVLSFFVGFLSSLLGIGGGIIHVPLLIRLLDFPVHVATATSHFILAIMAFAGTAVHVATGTFSKAIERVVLLSLGVIPGAQLGAALSHHVAGGWILRSLGIALGFAGGRILLLAF